MPTRYLMFLTVVSIGSWTKAANSDSVGRLPTENELRELAEHVRELPPHTFDITVVVEFDLEKVPEAELRRSVTSVYDRIDKERSIRPDRAGNEREVEQEVKRLLQEQELPRRAKERWRREGVRFRVDEVRTRTGLEDVENSKSWQSSFMYLPNLQNTEDPKMDTVKLDWDQRIMSLFDKRHGGLRPARDPWIGGTVGFSAAIMLKGALGMGAIAPVRLLCSLLTLFVTVFVVGS